MSRVDKPARGLRINPQRSKGMGHDETLKPTLALTDHMLFGLSSILGSGGFNLVGKAVGAGGSAWPELLAAVTAIFGGASWSYTRALQIEGTSTAETDIIGRMFGSAASGVTGGGILTFNIFSIAVILVFIAGILFPSAGWTIQVGFATLLLGIMTGFSLQGMDVNKEIINWTTWALVVVLFTALGLGGWGAVTGRGVGGGPPTVANAAKSLMYFFFILAGFDALMKFTQESVDPQRDLPIAFFGANALSAVLVFGVALAISAWAPGLSAEQENNAVGHMFAHFLGSNAIGSMKVAMIVFMLITTFVVFLSTTRYLHGVGKQHEELRWLSVVNEAQAPWRAVAAVAIICFLGLLIDRTDVLVKISNVGLVVVLGLVAAAVAVYDWQQGHRVSAAVNGATVAGLGGILRAAFL